MRKWLIKLLGGVPQEQVNEVEPGVFHPNETAAVEKPRQRLAMIVDMQEKDEFLPENQENHEQVSTHQ